MYFNLLFSFLLISNNTSRLGNAIFIFLVYQSSFTTVMFDLGTL